MLGGFSPFRCEKETSLCPSLNLFKWVSVVIKQMTWETDFGPGVYRSHSSLRNLPGLAIIIVSDFVILADPLFQVYLVFPLYFPHADFKVSATSCTWVYLCSWNFCSYLVLWFSGCHSSRWSGEFLSYFHSKISSAMCSITFPFPSIVVSTNSLSHSHWC